MLDSGEIAVTKVEDRCNGCYLAEATLLHLGNLWKDKTMARKINELIGNFVDIKDKFQSTCSGKPHRFDFPPLSYADMFEMLRFQKS